MHVLPPAFQFVECSAREQDRPRASVSAQAWPAVPCWRESGFGQQAATLRLPRVLGSNAWAPPQSQCLLPLRGARLRKLCMSVHMLAIQIEPKCRAGMRKTLNLRPQPQGHFGCEALPATGPRWASCR